MSVAAVTMAAVLVHREFLGDARVAASAEPRPSVYEKNWRQAVSVGHVIGDPTARIKIVEFADIECPFCKRFNEVARAVQAKHPHDIALVFVHFPISGHRYARTGARAVECSVPENHVGEIIDVLYRQQDSLGRRPWASFASEAGIRDSAQFSRCMGDTMPLPMVEAGLRAVKEFDIRGTPTVIVNGWRFGAPPSEDELSKAVNALLAGRAPYPGYPQAALGPT